MRVGRPSGVGAEMGELLPCPFCGGKAELWRAHPENPKRKAWVACMDRCAVMTKEYETNQEAAKAWNRRLDAERVRELEALLKPFALDADEWADSVPDDYSPLCTEPGSETAHLGSETKFTVGDLRRARSAVWPWRNSAEGRSE